MKPYCRIVTPHPSHPQETTLTSEAETLFSWACFCLPLSLLNAPLCNTKGGMLIQTLDFELKPPRWNESRWPQHPMVLLNKARNVPEWKTDNSGFLSRSHKVFLVFITLKVLKQVQNNLVIRILYPSIKKKKSLLYEAIHTWLKYTSCDRIKRQFEMGCFLQKSQIKKTG